MTAHGIFKLVCKTQTMLVHIEKILQEFENVQAQIDASSDKFEVELTKREEFENKFHSCISQAWHIIQNN